MEVKNTKSFVGQEGHGFNADLYLGRVKLAFVIDDASGGPVDFQWYGKTREEQDANKEKALAYVKALPPIPLPANAEEWERSLYPGGFRTQDLEWLVSDLVDDALHAKRLARLKQQSVLFRLPGQPEGEFIKVKHGGDPDGMRARVATKHPDASFL